jgi:drug/metabolite transporter (DMT)-like permease
LGLLLIVRLLRRPLPTSRRDLLRLVALGMLNYALYLGLTAIGLQHISAGMGAVLASTNPLMVALLAPWLLGERLGAQKIAGLLVAFGSVVAVMYARIDTGDDPLFMTLVLLANTLLVSGTILFKRWDMRHDLAAMNGIQLFAAGVALLIPSLLFEPVAELRLDANFIGAQIYQIFAMSWGAMLIWFFLLRNGDASKANAFFFLNPIFGLFLGALFLGEPLRSIDFAGTAGVALGIYLVLRSRS